jgi:glyoxylase-like metal-dependent hydrolase (beta-lactamase superfamily II)
MSKYLHNPMSRRGFCLCCVVAGGFAATGGWLTPSEAFAEARNLVDVFRDEAAKAEIRVHKVRSGISVLEGSGGNIAVLTGRDGKTFVDAGITGTRRRILEAANSLGHQPITTLINTHWHFDHTDGNEWLSTEGAAIIAHNNTHKHMLSAQRVEDWDFNFPSSPLAAIPTDAFAESKILKADGQNIQLKHYGNAHTDSDISVFFEQANTLHCGDTFWNGLYPFIDYSTGGNIDGMIAAANANLAMANGDTAVISGHGKPVGTRAELMEYRDMLVGIRDNVFNLKSQGLTLDRIVSARPTEKYDQKWGKAVISPAFFTKLVFEGV